MIHILLYLGMSNIAVNLAILNRKRYHDDKYLRRKLCVEAFSKVSLNRVFLKSSIFSFVVLMQAVRIQHSNKRYRFDKGISLIVGEPR